MTNLLYQKDSYLKEFQATITRVDPDNQAVILDQTAFYPGGGGQPADYGSLIVGETTYPVKRARKIGGEVIHQIDNDSSLPEPGQIAIGKIDWDHRYQLMQTHTAMHILCGVIFRDYGASVTGGQMEPTSSTRPVVFRDSYV